jgi:hypothetical protein
MLIPFAGIAGTVWKFNDTVVAMFHLQISSITKVATEMKANTLTMKTAP